MTSLSRCRDCSPPYTRFRTPHLAIATHALLVAAVAATNTFTHLALLSNVGLLTLYFLGCAAALRFVSRPRRPAPLGYGCRASGSSRWPRWP